MSKLLLRLSCQQAKAQLCARCSSNCKSEWTVSQEPSLLHLLVVKVEKHCWLQLLTVSASLALRAWESRSRWDLNGSISKCGSEGPER